MRNFLRFLAAVHMLLLQAEVPLWLALITWLMFFASFAREPLRLKFPKLVTSFNVELLSGAVAVAIFAKIRPVLGVESGTALIFCFLGLELFRLEDRRSQWRYLFLLMISLSLILLDFSGWLGTFFLIGDLIVIFQLMTIFEVGETQLSWGGLRAAITLILSSLPLWICIFLLFPRFSVELWGDGQAPAEVGFSESLDVGSIEKVVSTSEVAFRFRWRGPQPREPISYFRGAVLEQGEGLSWKLDAKSRVWERPDPKDVGLEQEIWGNPKNGRALIGLDRPTMVEVPSQQFEAFESQMFRLKRQPTGPFFYRVWSSSAEVSHQLSQVERDRLTKVSDNLREQVVKWWSENAGPWQDYQALPARRKITRIRELLQKQNFRYSLNPGSLQTGTMMEFLTSSRTGFCEHFAATTATLLRAGGVPARVAVGFLGGRPDPFTADWVVMTREAHAWVEFFDEASADWIRVDPTLWIEPLRWDLGADINWLSPEMRAQFALSGEKFLPFWPRLQERMRLAWEASFGAGERWVISYNTDWVKGALAPIGAERYGDAFSFVLLLGSAGALMALLPWLRSRFRRRDPWAKLWQQFEKRLRWEPGSPGPEMRRWESGAGTLGPATREASELFVQAYLRARYQDPASRWTPEKKKNLRRLLRQIPRPSRRWPFSRPRPAQLP